MKKVFTIIATALLGLSFQAQQNYNDFEGNKFASLAHWNGIMDSTALNPMPTSTVNSSAICAKYIRDTAKYDNFKLFPYSTLVDVSPYATNTAGAPKMTMKLFTKAAVGTKIDLQLGVRSNTTYPAGIHSEYTGVTTAQNAWQEITFNYVGMPVGSTVSATSIDKIVIFFRPNSNVKDTIYFDDVTGPQLTPIGLLENTVDHSLKLEQNKPNPANESTEITFSLKEQENIKIELFNIMGARISTVSEGRYMPGTHKVSVKTSELSSGIYFYTLSAGNSSLTRKMMVTK